MGKTSNAVIEVFEEIAETAKKSRRTKDVDYYRDDGCLICGNCHQPKLFLADFTAISGRVDKRWMPVMCKCEEEEYESNRGQLKAMDISAKVKRLREEGIRSPAYRNCTVEKDDRHNPQISNLCLKYVDKWKEMRANNIGILFYGDVGTGKSFFACAIANELVNKGIPVYVENLAKIVNQMQGFGAKKEELIADLEKSSLLVIDDLGTERDTTFGIEQVYNLFDSRLRSGKPLIVTTNLGLGELENPQNIQYKRIYDRVLEMCPIRIKVEGESRRKVKAQDRKTIAKEILGG